MTFGPNTSIYFERLYLQILKDLQNLQRFTAFKLSFQLYIFNKIEYSSGQNYSDINRMNCTGGVIFKKVRYEI